ncbi:MAG: phosphotransferase [Actinopolymorphaceae bacterium]
MADETPAAEHTAVDALVGPVLGVLVRERPDIAVEPVRLVYTGFSSHVLTTGSGFVVRVTRTAEAADGHRREMVLLPRLAQLLPVAVPSPVWRLEAGRVSRYGAMAYDRIDGSPLAWDTPCPEGFVDRLADFLARVHRIDVPSVATGVVPLEGWKQAVIMTTCTAVDHLEGAVSAVEHGRLRRWCDEFVGHVDALPPRDAVMVHGDFWHDNILTRGNELAGVLDWEAAAVADPAVDLAPVWDIDPNLGAALLGSYRRRTRLDPSLADRIRLFRIARNVGGITWSLNNNDPEEYTDSLGKVRDVLPLTEVR